MEDYRTRKQRREDEKNGKSEYIIDASIVGYQDEDETYETIEVTYADGRVFGDIENTEEMREKIKGKQKTQIENGLELLPGLKTKVKLLKNSSLIAGLIGIGSITTGYIISHQSLMSPEENTLALAALGTIAIFSEIPIHASLRKDVPKYKELSKFDMLKQYEQELKETPNYRNSLVGVKSEIADFIEECYANGEDPFALSDGSPLEQKDIRQILNNLETEKNMGFQYIKRNEKQEEK